MLRNFQYHPNEDIILEVLSRFEFEIPSRITLLKFGVITPDSFMWQFIIGDKIYYLYAEDYVSGLEYIRSVYGKYLGKHQWSFIAPKSAITFENSAPVKSATIYQKASDSDEMMQYAVDSGHDFVFLACSDKNPNTANFQD